MALNADTLIDRLQLKQQVTKWRMIAILTALFAVILFIEYVTEEAAHKHGYVARLTVEGIITDDTKRDELIAGVRDDKKVKAVIVRIDSPGGTTVGGEELFHQLRELGKVKPVVAVIRTLGTSAGYMVALGTDYIVARDGTITGSIGVIMQMAEFTELAQKLGITPITIKSSPLKGSPSPLEKLSPEAEAVLREMIKEYHGIFISMVAERRNLPREKVQQIADGRVYSGRQALELKLIDAIGGEEEAQRWLEEKRNIRKSLEIKDVEAPSEELGFLRELTRSAVGGLIPSLPVKLDGLVSIWHPNLN